jgi:Domain of unknown function (DUF1917)
MSKKTTKATKITARNPSEVNDVYWLYAEPQSGQKFRQPVNVGKWLVFVGLDKLDEVWRAIKHATEDGKLGIEAKVATMKPSPFDSHYNTKVICVYTYDWTDKDDVMRVREGLRSLGIIDKIPYKSDEDTYNGKYAYTGSKRISKYYA